MRSKKQNKDRAIFLDRDGTVTEEVGYVNDPNRLTLLPRAGKAIKLINQSPFKAILTTNQAGVARGYFSESMVLKVNRWLETLLMIEGAFLDKIYYCPHHPETGKKPYRSKCNCRKPKPGMLLKASRDFNLDLSISYVIGDKLSDVDFAKNAGAMPIIVKSGYGKGELKLNRSDSSMKPFFIAEDLLEAVLWIFSQEGIETENRTVLL